jgi:tRNA U34 5-methylaminomethyl-2-thiouridine-forming methyltransferase MnmC
MNNRIEIRETADGSKTLYLPDLDENYHSFHGAIQEAQHVFIKNGLDALKNLGTIFIFEMGFGTGLNALLTAQWSGLNAVSVDYTGIEAFPVSLEICSQLEYTEQIDLSLKPLYHKLIASEWQRKISLSNTFEITKIEGRVEDWLPEKQFDLIYFDAFGPRAQSEMWNIDILGKMYEALKSKGMLVTYCAQGQFKRNLKSLGFTLESLPGPPGKREMTRAWKN